MPKAVIRKRRRKTGPLALAQKAILRAYTAGADATDIEKAHTSARVDYVKERMGLRIPRRALK